MSENNNQSARKAAESAFAHIGFRSDFVGRRYINLLRCSSHKQSDTSPDGQKEVNDAYCAFQKMTWAGDDIFAEGVSGSQTFNREDIAEILYRKKTKNDFDTVVVFEYARATRGGIRHGNVVEDELRKAGIELISSTELIPDGPAGDLIKAVKHFSNQQQGQNISLAVARGLAQSLTKATRPAAARTNFGLDRLYVGPDGAPRTLIRWEGHTQLRLDPVSHAVVGRAVRPPSRKPRKKDDRRPRERRKQFVGYTKQKDETSRLIPGASISREAVCTIWRMYYMQGIGAHRIIKHLRKNRIGPAGGGKWHLTSVHNILWNPIYLGIEVRHRWTKALYHQLGPDGPIPVKVNQDQLQREGRRSVPQTERGRNDWVLVDKADLKNFLPEDVRKAATPRILAMYDEDRVVARQAKWAMRKNKNDDGPYVLSHILHSAQTGHAMRGDSVNKKLVGGQKVYRYYFDYSTASEAVSGLNARRVPAEALEEAVMPAVFEVLSDRSWIADRVRGAADQTQGVTISVEQQRAELQTERDEIVRRLKRIHRTSQSLTEEELESIVADDNLRLVKIRRELATLDQPDANRPPTPQEAMAAIEARLSVLPSDWRLLPNAELKTLLSAVIEKLTIDLVTFEVTMALHLPQVAMQGISCDTSEVRVNFTSLWSSVLDSNRQEAVFLDQITCGHDRSQKCYGCWRHRRAA
jgi:hypothetical protein